jgi:mono/diheme cytochrome c family protein
VFVAQCLACHTLNGGGAATIGPDLNQPMSPVDYFQPAALRRLIRDPASVRHWPGRSMPAFGPQQLDERALDDLIAYLRHMAQGRRAAP